MVADYRVDFTRIEVEVDTAQGIPLAVHVLNIAKLQTWCRARPL
jgi:hypothetical protein